MVREEDSWHRVARARGPVVWRGDNTAATTQGMPVNTLGCAVKDDGDGAKPGAESARGKTRRVGETRRVGASRQQGAEEATTKDKRGAGVAPSIARGEAPPPDGDGHEGTR